MAITNSIEEAFRGAAASIEHLVRAVVREELRQHLGPEADHLINVRSAPMSARKLRQLVRDGELRGYKHGRDTFISAAEFRALIQGRPVVPGARTVVTEPSPDSKHDADDDLLVALKFVPADPVERQQLRTRLARRRAEGGARAATLAHAEAERDRMDETAKKRADRAARRAEQKRSRSR